MKMKVRDSLPFGRENAIPAKVLAEALGFPSDRELRKQIERERAAGAVILSDCHRGRYYLSNDPEELRRFTRTLNARRILPRRHNQPRRPWMPPQGKKEWKDGGSDGGTAWDYFIL